MDRYTMDNKFGHWTSAFDTETRTWVVWPPAGGAPAGTFPTLQEARQYMQRQYELQDEIDAIDHGTGFGHDGYKPRRYSDTLE